MSTYRGIDTYLIDRVTRAGSPYLSESTLRFFDTYGGPAVAHGAGGDILSYVLSDKTWAGVRVYRIVTFVFYVDACGRERVMIHAPSTLTGPDDAPAPHAYGSSRAAARHAAVVREAIRTATDGMTTPWLSHDDAQRIVAALGAVNN